MKAVMDLVYHHKTHGVLPVAYNEIICLSSVKMQEETCYPISSKTFEIEEIMDYMHEEHGYMETQPNQTIPYEVAKEFNKFQ